MGGARTVWQASSAARSMQPTTGGGRVGEQKSCGLWDTRLWGVPFCEQAGFPGKGSPARDTRFSYSLLLLPGFLGTGH